MGSMVYGKSSCLYCRLAVELLQKEGIPHHYIDVVKEPDEKEYMAQHVYEATGEWVTTVPQIFIDNEYVGGYDDLEELLGKREQISASDFNIDNL